MSFLMTLVMSDGFSLLDVAEETGRDIGRNMSDTFGPTLGTIICLIIFGAIVVNIFKS